MAAPPWYIGAASGYTYTGTFRENVAVAADEFRTAAKVSLPADLLQL